eukprot:1229089-Rhodomonas_salina.1
MAYSACAASWRTTRHTSACTKQSSAVSQAPRVDQPQTQRLSRRLNACRNAPAPRKMVSDGAVATVSPVARRYMSCSIPVSDVTPSRRKLASSSSG